MPVVSITIYCLNNTALCMGKMLVTVRHVSRRHATHRFLSVHYAFWPFWKVIVASLFRRPGFVSSSVMSFPCIRFCGCLLAFFEPHCTATVGPRFISTRSIHVLSLPTFLQNREYVSTQSGSRQVLMLDCNNINLRHDGIGYRHEDFIKNYCISFLERSGLQPALDRSHFHLPIF